MALTAQQKREKRDAALRAEGAAAARAELLASQPNADITGGVSRATADLNVQSATRPDQVADAHGQIARPSSAGAKVTVACKLGLAYLDIQHSRIVTKFEQNMQGGKDIREAERVGQVVRLRGTAYPRGTPPKGFPPPPEIVGGAALNRGIDKEWFDAWLEQNKLNPIVQNKMVFAHESEDHIRGQAAELSKFLSGLEPVNPDGDHRIPKSSRPSEVTELETGQR
jgi:hypothetical protein